MRLTKEMKEHVISLLSDHDNLNRCIGETLEEMRAMLGEIDALRDAIEQTIVRADDHADSYISKPIREVLK